MRCCISIKNKSKQGTGRMGRPSKGLQKKFADITVLTRNFSEFELPDWAIGTEDCK